MANQTVKYSDLHRGTPVGDRHDPKPHMHAQSEVDQLPQALANKAPLNSPAFTGTPTGITKAHVGLGNVDNTADLAKPVSTATQTALTDRLAKAGGVMTGYISLHADPTSAMHPATKQYADAINTKRQVSVRTVGSSGADYLFGSYASPRAAINQAITDLSTAGGGIVQLKAEQITITGQIVPKDNVLLRGMGRATILSGGVSSGYTVTNPNASPITNFGLSDLIIDCSNVANASGIRLNRATGCYGANVLVRNVAAGGWGMVLGDTATGGDITCFNNQFVDYAFQGHAGSLEMLLVFDAEQTRFIRPTFTGKSSYGPILGVYQRTKHTRFINPVFKDNQGFCIYYSVSCHDTVFIDPYFENCGSAFQGANQSDNGLFGETQAQRLRIIRPTLIGGANSASSYGIQLGAVNDAVVDRPFIEGYQIGMIVDDGNTVASTTSATNWVIRDPIIKNGNPGNDYPDIHAGILFRSIGGGMSGRISGGAIYDDQPTKTQRNPIVFDGAFSWDRLEIAGIRLAADNANGGQSIKLTNGATLGSLVLIRDIGDVSGPVATSLSQKSAIDIELIDATKGVILKSPDGNRWRVKVGNGGALTTEAA